MAMLVIAGPVATQAAEGPVTSKQDATAVGTASEACSNDPARLGVSRVVEVDTASAPNFGESHFDFLNDHEVVLTFDDGPVPRFTGSILKALADHCTKATFFMVGRMAAEHPQMVKEVAEAGHTVGFHTWSHKNQRALSLERGIREFELGVSAVTAALGRPAAPFFRYPYLSDSRRMVEYVKTRGMATWWVDVDSKDYKTRTPNLVIKRIMAQLAKQKKGIILMHDIQRSSVGAINELLDDLQAQGYKVVHIVPKDKATTVASFDETIEKMMSGNKKALASSDQTAKPQRVRVSAPKSEKSESRTSARHKLVKHRKSRRADVNTKRRRVADSLPWKPTTFGY